MKKLIEDNYQSIVDRGLITPTTYFQEFIDKIKEETEELQLAKIFYDSDNIKEELADVIMVCLNMAKHYDIDIINEIKKKIKVNQQRAKDGK